LHNFDRFPISRLDLPEVAVPNILAQFDSFVHPQKQAKHKGQFGDIRQRKVLKKDDSEVEQVHKAMDSKWHSKIEYILNFFF
jgi:hypothetical protein